MSSGATSIVRECVAALKADGCLVFEVGEQHSLEHRYEIVMPGELVAARLSVEEFRRLCCMVWRRVNEPPK